MSLSCKPIKQSTPVLQPATDGRSLKKIVSQCKNRDAVDGFPLWLVLDEVRKIKTSEE